MGTSKVYFKYNDFGAHLHSMTKKELDRLDKLSPYIKDNYFLGWRAPFELHNGNAYILIFWKGRLMKIEDAPAQLNKKYWDKYRGKTHNLYEWTILKKLILNEVEYLDKKFKKELRIISKKK